MKVLIQCKTLKFYILIYVYVYVFCLFVIYYWFYVWNSKIQSVSWGQSWRRGTKCDCKIGWLWFRSPLEEMKYLFTFLFYCSTLVSRQRAALSSTTHHAIPPELGGNRGTKCINIRFPLPAGCWVRDTVLSYFFFK